MTTRIVIVDDHQLVRDGLESMLKGLDGSIDVIGHGATGREAVELAADLAPDIMLIDVAMPGVNGIDATREILTTNPDIRIVAVTMHAERSFIAGMLQAGAKGYIRKESAFEEISAAIDAVLQGRTYLGDGIAEIAVASDIMDDDDDRPALSDREKEVLTLLAEGMKTRQIAKALFVSEKTVETHRRQISRKLDLYSVAELTKYAIRNGLTSVE
ncbi:MAG: response regulator transcription factor [Pseudomonadota bacterium]